MVTQKRGDVPHFGTLVLVSVTSTAHDCDDFPTSCTQSFDGLQYIYQSIWCVSIIDDCQDVFFGDCVIKTPIYTVQFTHQTQDFLGLHAQHICRCIDRQQVVGIEFCSFLLFLFAFLLLHLLSPIVIGFGRAQTVLTVPNLMAKQSVASKRQQVGSKKQPTVVVALSPSLRISILLCLPSLAGSFAQ